MTEADDDALAGQVAAAAEPIESVEPGAGGADLDGLLDAVADADVLGLGEASHGTREFHLFRSRLTRRLVERGLRLVGFEANFAACLDVNEYVTRGEGSARAALEQEGIHPSYRTESVLELLEWLRSFNEGREDRVAVHGYDIQRPGAAARRLRSYVEAVDPDAVAGVSGALDRLATGGFPEFGDDADLQADLDARAAAVAALGDALEDREEAFVAATSRAAYDRARRLVWQLEQGRRQFEAIADGRAETGANVRIRDSAMAAQAGWLRRHGPGERIALWGHNAHLTRGSFGGGTTRHRQGIPSLGMNLAGLSGIEYHALALETAGGRVRAVHGPSGESRVCAFGDPPAGSVPAVFGKAGSLFHLDTRDLAPPLADWLASRPDHYDIAGGYRESPVSLVASSLVSGFDGVVFVRETGPTRPLTASSWR